MPRRTGHCDVQARVIQPPGGPEKWDIVIDTLLVMLSGEAASQRKGCVANEKRVPIIPLVLISAVFITPIPRVYMHLT